MSDAVAHIDFDFDAEVPGAKKKPFVANLAGRAIVCANPAEEDWQALLDAGNDPVELLRLVIKDDEDKAFFQEQHVPAAKLERFVKAIMAHYGLGDQGKGSGRLI